MEASDGKNDELIDAIRKGLTEIPGIVGAINNELMECANLLRVEESERTFVALTESIKDLNQLIEFVKELKIAVGQLKGIDIPGEIFSCWDRSLNVFKEMLSAIENKDWITLSDLIQYEIYPLLEEGGKGLAEVLSITKYA